MATITPTPVTIPPRPQPSPDRATLTWAHDRFDAADAAWTKILPSVIGNHTPRWDGKIHSAMMAGLEQAKAGNAVIEEITGLKTPSVPYVGPGEKYNQAQMDLSEAMYNARNVGHGDSTEAMQAILAVRTIAAKLFNMANDNGAGYYSGDKVFPIVTKPAEGRTA